MGGGNVAMDAARSALRLGAETVYIVYRRGMAELPARKEEVEHAEEEGIIFKTLCNPVEIHANDEGFVKSITCIEMELGEPDASGRRRPIEKQGSEFELDVDTVIMSLGTSPNPLIRSTTPGLETNKHGCIVTEGDEGKTSREGVYAGGDAVTGAATVIKPWVPVRQPPRPWTSTSRTNNLDSWLPYSGSSAGRWHSQTEAVRDSADIPLWSVGFLLYPISYASCPKNRAIFCHSNLAESD